jgi:hypothetical protein
MFPKAAGRPLWLLDALQPRAQSVFEHALDWPGMQLQTESVTRRSWRKFVPESQRRAVNSLMELPTNGVIQ